MGKLDVMPNVQVHVEEDNSVVNQRDQTKKIKLDIWGIIKMKIGMNTPQNNYYRDFSKYYQKCSQSQNQ